MSETDSKQMTFQRFAGELAAGERVVVDAQFIGGEWRTSGGAQTFDVISPTTEAPIAGVRSATAEDVSAAVAAARAAFVSRQWASMDLEDRVAVIERVCADLAGSAEDSARVQTEQMGAPISGTRAAVGRRVVANMRSNIKAAMQLAPRFLLDDDEGMTLVERRPVGVVGIILPWNAPLSFEVDKVSAALLAGCPVVLKAAPETPLDAFALASAFARAGLPPGILNVVAGGGDVGGALVAHPDVARITFTGSTATGRVIAGICADRFARVSLELGGKSAAVVLDDADLDRAAAVLASANFGNAGQACHALTRVLVPRRLQADLVERVRELARAMVIGDPRAPETQLGPLVAERQRDRVENYVRLAKDAGATVATGGQRPAHLGRGWFFEPTVLTGVTNDMRVAREEIFGPVMSVLTYDGEEEAIALANDSEYGLGGAVFSADTDRALDVARLIHTGTCAINAWGMTRSAPFGGVKNSGIGREHGPWGIASCLETHAIRLDGSTLADLDVASERQFRVLE